MSGVSHTAQWERVQGTQMEPSKTYPSEQVEQRVGEINTKPSSHYKQLVGEEHDAHSGITNEQ